MFDGQGIHVDCERQCLCRVGANAKQCTTQRCQARIQGVGVGARAHLWGGVSPFKMHYSIAFKHQFIIGRPPLGEILYPPLGASAVRYCAQAAAVRE